MRVKKELTKGPNDGVNRRSGLGLETWSISSPCCPLLLLVSNPAALPSLVSGPETFTVVEWCGCMVVTWRSVDVSVVTRLEPFCRC
jgi:hypothetical protein